ncbi:MAG: DUF192 domain-containing protein [Alphaproteobacteria bacterium]|nr:MAG: DUF192 domain-containing protein [Alphaproteobacteria bacterium]
MKFLLAAAAALMAVQPVMAACPNAGLASVPVTFMTKKGRSTYAIEVAATPAQQECGLMYRKAMPRKTGMMFPFDPPKAATFWMENTPLPLDLIFVGPDDRVINVAPGMPYSRDIIASDGIAASVIELNAGEAKRIGLRPGDKVQR